MRLHSFLTSVLSITLLALLTAETVSAQKLLKSIDGGEAGQYFGSVVGPVGGSEENPTALVITGILSRKMQVSPIIGNDPPTLLDLSMLPNNAFSQPVAASGIAGTNHFVLLHGGGRLAHLVSAFDFNVKFEINLDRGTVCRDVSMIGDLNRDGASDFALGCPNRFSSAAQLPIELGGAVYIYSGVDKSLITTLSGKPTENFGTSVAGAGDVNADGYPDIVVGVVPSSTTGRVEVYSGRTGTLLYSFKSPENTLDFGIHVAGVHDVNRDGHDDIAAGAPTESVNKKIRNLVRVFSGRDGSVLHTFIHNDSSSFFGIVNSAGDFNGDGFPDIIVGSPRYADNSGRAFIYSGNNGKIIASLSLGLNKGAQNLFGNQVGSAGRGSVYIGIPRNALHKSSGIVNLYAYDPTCSNQLANNPIAIQCGCGMPDTTDEDNDGTMNCLDECPHDTQKTKVGSCGCGVPETDSDGDGIPDCNDTCGNSAKGAPGACGCGVPDTDSDTDGMPDCLDQCPFDPTKVSPGACGCKDPGVAAPSAEQVVCPGDAALALLKLTKPKIKKIRVGKLKRTRVTMMDLTGRAGDWKYVLIVRQGKRLVKQVTTRDPTVKMQLKNSDYSAYYFVKEGSDKSAPSPTKKFKVRY